jgi:hypothetical protein
MLNWTLSGTRLTVLRAAAVALLPLTLCVPPSEAAGADDGVAAPTQAKVEDIVAGYNAGIRNSMAAVESLRVEQDLLEPQEEGKENREAAVLTYTREGGMTREKLESTIGHRTGEYTLASLIGPELTADAYAVSLAGVESKDGRECYHLLVEALVRDLGHFDGDVWVTVDGFHLVRITGTVADPPYPVVLVKLDKAFEPGPGGLWLLRRHTGEVELHLGFIKRRGMIHIFYDNYSVTVSPPGAGETAD